jgi:hypothetical protein
MIRKSFAYSRKKPSVRRSLSKKTQLHFLSPLSHACNRRGCIHRAACPLLGFSNAAAFSSRGLPVRTLRAHSTSLLLRAHSASLLPRAHPAPLAPARRAHPSRRPPGRAKPGAATDGGGDGAARCRLQPRRLESPGPGPPCWKRMFQMFQMFRRYVSSVSCTMLHMLQ